MTCITLLQSGRSRERADATFPPTPPRNILYGHFHKSSSLAVVCNRLFDWSGMFFHKRWLGAKFDGSNVFVFNSSNDASILLWLHLYYFLILFFLNCLCNAFKSLYIKSRHYLQRSLSITFEICWIAGKRQVYKNAKAHKSMFITAVCVLLFYVLIMHC